MDNPIRQEKVIDYLSKYPNVGVIIPIHGKMPTLGEDVFFQCCMAPSELVEEEMKTDCTNKWSSFSPGFTQYGFGDNSEIAYHRFGNSDGFEPLVIVRSFDGLGVDDKIEISEEFRLLNNLYFDHLNGVYIDLENETTVVKIENGLVTINKNYLIRYLAVKEMPLLVHLSSIAYNHGSDPKIEKGNEPFCLKGKNVTISYGTDEFARPKRNYSNLYAKMVISGCCLDDCGYWPYTEMQRQYEEFIIGVDDLGKEVTFTSNPHSLNGHGRKNNNAPDYFSLVFFKRDVLQKYYANPKRYTIGDGFLRCGYNWMIYIDNQSTDYVSAYLGDLGRDLPSQQEQKHWRQHNIVIDGKLSRAKWNRDFGSLFTPPDSPVFLFQGKYELLNKAFEKRLGWSLFLPLAADDIYNITGLRVPLSNAQPEFDMQILCLVKVLIDSLNEKALSSFFDNKTLGIKGSIGKLEQMLKTVGIQGIESHVSFLRDLQELRSTGTGHRKGKSYIKASNKFGLQENGFRTVFVEIVNKAVEFLDFVNCIVSDIDSFQCTKNTEGSI